MLLECGFCGAPLEVKQTAAMPIGVSKCGYCGKSSRIGAMKTLSPITPANWAPPKVWRPPVHVQADSNVVLRYHGSGAGPAAAVIVALVVLVLGGVVAGIAARGGSLRGLSYAQLDPVTMLESPTELQKKIGGAWNESARWVLVGMQRPFSNVVFTYWGEDRSRPSGITFNVSSKGCSDEYQQMRARVAKKLGPRFDGKELQWAGARLTFDDKCSNILVGTDVGKENDELAKKQAEVLFRLVKGAIFQRNFDVTEEETRGLLGGGYEAQTIATALSGTTIDDVKTKVAKQLVGTEVKKSSGVTATIPFASSVFSAVDVGYKNKKGGGIDSMYFRTLGYKKLADPIALAQCVGKRLGGTVKVAETDYAAHTSTAYVTMKTGRLYIADSSYSVSPNGEVIPDELVSGVLLATDACDGD